MKIVEGEMRAEYKRSDFSKLERGKFYKEVAKGTSVVLLDPGYTGGVADGLTYSG